MFRTYFVNARGDETMGNTWSYLDLTALGRQEGYPQTPPYEWWIWHDEPHRTDPIGSALRVPGRDSGDLGVRTV